MSERMLVFDRAESGAGGKVAFWARDVLSVRSFVVTGGSVEPRTVVAVELRHGCGVEPFIHVTASLEEVVRLVEMAVEQLDREEAEERLAEAASRLAGVRRLTDAVTQARDDLAG